MHKCKTMRKGLLDLALNEVTPDQRQSLLAELNHCAACFEEYASLRTALRVTEQAMQFAQPAESFWYRYEARLRQRLRSDSESFANPSPRTNVSILIWLRKLMTTSVPVPVPLASALFVFVVFSIFFMMHSRSSLSATPALTAASIITTEIEVPVVQEKIVTRVVYRDVQRRPRGLRSQSAPEVTSAFADLKKGLSVSLPINLVGFKPANDAKLTIIKGSYRDEK